MKQIFYCYFFFGVFFLGCDNNKDKNTIPDCKTDNPIEELDWLKDIKGSYSNCTCQISILQGKYKEKTVFYEMMTDPVCDGVFNVTLWDCNGDVVKEYKENDFSVFTDEVEFVKNLYTCSE
jgi:hypothetical protein